MAFVTCLFLVHIFPISFGVDSFFPWETSLKCSVSFFSPPLDMDSAMVVEKVSFSPVGEYGQPNK